MREVKKGTTRRFRFNKPKFFSRIQPRNGADICCIGPIFFPHSLKVYVVSRGGSLDKFEPERHDISRLNYASSVVFISPLIERKQCERPCFPTRLDWFVRLNITVSRAIVGYPKDQTPPMFRVMFQAHRMDFNIHQS